MTLFLSATQMMTVAAESDEVVAAIGEVTSAELSEETVQDLDENTDVLLDYEVLYDSVHDGIIEDGVYAFSLGVQLRQEVF